MQNRKLTWILGGLLALASEVALAQFGGGKSIGAIAGNVDQSMIGVKALILSVVFIIGLLLAAGALLKFKAHRDNPQQTPIGMPMTMLVISACMIGIPMVLQTGVETIWGAGSSAGMQTGVAGAPGQNNGW